MLSALDDLAERRLRLGIGSSHRPIIEGTYGFKMVKPLEYLREYIQILRAALWKGKVNHKGTFFTGNATLPRIAQIPLLTSALREMHIVCIQFCSTDDSDRRQ
jgi:alkanesulfonate monooxygenase SsuD/methylene tetrahydromethanopterin reductase-like flavin-dependent oxidoreductase (luciferase family)